MRCPQALKVLRVLGIVEVAKGLEALQVRQAPRQLPALSLIKISSAKAQGVKLSKRAVEIRMNSLGACRQGLRRKNWETNDLNV